MSSSGQIKVAMNQDELEKFREFMQKEESEKRKFVEQELEANEKVITALDMALYPVKVVLRGVKDVMDILSPLGWAEFEEATRRYKKEDGMRVIKPVDANLSSYVLVLDGKTPMDPQKHINPTAPFGCIAMLPLTMNLPRLRHAEIQSIKTDLLPYITRLFNSPKPSLGWVKLDDAGVVRDAISWTPFLSSTGRASVGIYHNKKRTSFMLMVNSHFDVNIVQEISELIRSGEIKTAQEFGEHPVLKYMKNLASRNVKRILADIVVILAEKGYISNNPPITDDMDAKVEKREARPLTQEPQWSLHYNDFYWDQYGDRLSLYYNLSGGHTMSSASAPALDSIVIGPYKRGFKVIDFGNAVSRGRVHDFIHGHIISTGDSSEKKVNVTNHHIISLSGKPFFDFNDFDRDSVYIKNIYQDQRINPETKLIETFETDLVFIP